MYYFWSPSGMAQTPGSKENKITLNYSLTEQGTSLWHKYPAHREWLTKLAIQEVSKGQIADLVFSILDHDGKELKRLKTVRIGQEGPP